VAADGSFNTNVNKLFCRNVLCEWMRMIVPIYIIIMTFSYRTILSPLEENYLCT